MHKPKRKRVSIRLKDFDYSQPGGYFVTVCAQGHRQIFGAVRGDEMLPNMLGLIVENEWLRTPLLREGTTLDAFVVMPNHFHGILMIEDCEATMHRGPTFERFGRPVTSSLSTIMRSFKAAVSRRSRRLCPHACDIWQPRFYDHIIRDERCLEKIRDYILSNPARWSQDRENPAATACDPFDSWIDSFKNRPPSGAER